MTDELTLEELSARTGEPVEGLHRWRELGLIGAGDRFRPEDVERARLIQLLLRRGIGLEAVVERERERGFLDRYVEVSFPDGVGPTYTLAQASEILGLDLDFTGRVWAASGLGKQGEQADGDDLRALGAAKERLGAGFPLG